MSSTRFESRGLGRNKEGGDLAVTTTAAGAAGTAAGTTRSPEGTALPGAAGAAAALAAAALAQGPAAAGAAGGATAAAAAPRPLPGREPRPGSAGRGGDELEAEIGVQKCFFGQLLVFSLVEA